MKKRPWSASEVALLRAKYPDTSTTELAREMGRTVGQLHQAATRFGLKKSAAYMAGPHAFILRRRSAGVEHRFKAGLVPWNKGLKGVNGHSSSQFKPGHKSHAWKPIGSERMTKDGHLQRKLTDTGADRDWVSVHVQLWTEAHGPVPNGHVVVFKDGDRRCIELSNLELLTRRELLERNTAQRFPQELRQLIHLKGMLTKKIGEYEKSNDRSA